MQDILMTYQNSIGAAWSSVNRDSMTVNSIIENPVDEKENIRTQETADPIYTAD